MAKVRALLDTSVLIDGAQLTRYGDVAISVVSLAELHYGVLKTKDAAERQRRLRRLAAIENRFTALPVTAEVARIQGAMAASLESKNRKSRRRSMDLMIAATASAHDALLVTSNIDDFIGLDEFVRVEHSK